MSADQKPNLLIVGDIDLSTRYSLLFYAGFVRGFTFSYASPFGGVTEPSIESMEILRLLRLAAIAHRRLNMKNLMKPDTTNNEAKAIAFWRPGSYAEL